MTNNWKSIFNYTPLNMKCCPQEVKEYTQRIQVRNPLFGDEIKLKFSNVHGETAMYFDKVTIALAKDLHNEIRIIASGFHVLYTHKRFALKLLTVFCITTIYSGYYNSQTQYIVFSLKQPLNYFH